MKVCASVYACECIRLPLAIVVTACLHSLWCKHCKTISKCWPERKFFRPVSLLIKIWLYLSRCASGTAQSPDVGVNLCHTHTHSLLICLTRWLTTSTRLLT